MNTRKSQRWTAKNLVQFSHNLGEGYVPGLGDETAKRDRWTAQRHIEVSTMASHGYNPGF
jgi:hypothetical protein